MINLVSLPTVPEAKITEFLLHRRDGFFVYSPKHLELIREMVNVNDLSVCAVSEQNEVLGLLPLFSMNGAYGTVLNSSPFYGSHGGILASSLAVFDELQTYYNRCLQDPKTGSGTIITNPFQDQLNGKYHYQYSDYRIGQLTPLPKNTTFSEDDLMILFHTKTRNMVRKALSQNLNVSVENGMINFIKTVHKENMDALNGRAKPDEFFETFKRIFEPGKDYKIYIAYKDGQPIAGLLNFYYNGIVEYYTPVIKEEFRSSQALTAIIFQAMIDAVKRGFLYWNWGGTWQSQEGVYRFKSRFGAIDKRYNYYTTLKNESILNCTPEELLNEYPHMFVVPFSALKHACKGEEK